MRSAASQDAYARYDIQNLLGQYDGPWYKKFNDMYKSQEFAYNRVVLQGTYEVGRSYFIKDWLFTNVNTTMKTKLKSRFTLPKGENVFFYGSLVTYSADPALPNNAPNATIQLIIEDSVGIRQPVIDISNTGNGGNSMFYGTGTSSDNLFNKMIIVDQGASPVNNGIITLDGIIIGLPNL